MPSGSLAFVGQPRKPLCREDCTGCTDISERSYPRGHVRVGRCKRHLGTILSKRPRQGWSVQTRPPGCCCSGPWDRSRSNLQECHRGPHRDKGGHAEVDECRDAALILELLSGGDGQLAVRQVGVCLHGDSGRQGRRARGPSLSSDTRLALTMRSQRRFCKGDVACPLFAMSLELQDVPRRVGHDRIAKLRLLHPLQRPAPALSAQRRQPIVCERRGRRRATKRDGHLGP